MEIVLVPVFDSVQRHDKETWKCQDSRLTILLVTIVFVVNTRLLSRLVFLLLVLLFLLFCSSVGICESCTLLDYCC